MLFLGQPGLFSKVKPACATNFKVQRFWVQGFQVLIRLDVSAELIEVISHRWLTTLFNLPT